MTTVNYQHTRVIAVVHSHINGENLDTKNTGRVVDLSDSVVSLTTSKNIKSMGSWQINLVPDRNWFNFLFPNDVVNIYADIGDGKSGFVRLMFGYIDRVERMESVDDTGAQRTVYSVTGSDFQKAIDKTSIYFNSYMRQILDERFARTDQAAILGSARNDAEGAALRNAGLTVFGTPADFVENFLNVLLGFGQQWRLPAAYVSGRLGRTAINDARDKRKQRVLSRMPQTIVDYASVLGFDLEAITKQFNTDLAPQLDQLQNPSIIQQITRKIVKTLAEETYAENFEKVQAANILKNNAALSTWRAVQAVSDYAYPAAILDLISFDFIEALSVDGWHHNAAIWQSSGTLAQFLYGNCNAVVNELIFDLRPVSAGEVGIDGGLRPGGYSKLPDELGINVNGHGNMAATVAGVKYVPAVVFREYPYSVVERFKLEDITILPGGSADSSIKVNETVEFGPVFSQNINPDVPTRVTYTYGSPISPNVCQFSRDAKPVKHLDVVTIVNTDVSQSNLGRSDDDLFNVFQLMPHEPGLSEHYMSLMSNFSPVLNQISIARHGLRAWDDTTQFANMDPNAGCEVGGAADNARIRLNLARWQLLMDHWYQHNIEYISGTIELRGMPEIRVGYRLDWLERNESYYVEAVSHKWDYPGSFTTTVQVTRGQRNDPFPVYVPPVFINESKDVITKSSGDRSQTGRLAQFFKINDTDATIKSVTRQGPHAVAGNVADMPWNIAKSGVVVFPDVGIRGGPTNVVEPIGKINSLDDLPKTSTARLPEAE